MTEVESDSSEPRPVRLGVWLAAEVAAVLRHWTGIKRISFTEGIRRAIAAWNFLETERAKGNRFVVLEDGPNGERIREIIWLE